MISVRLFAAARDAAGGSRTDTAARAETLGDLVAELAERHGARMAGVLGQCSFVVDGRVLRSGRDDAVRLEPFTTVDVMPPFAGG